MDRLDRLVAELDGALARLDAGTSRGIVTRPEPSPATGPPPSPGLPPTPEPARAGWYWTTPASLAPPPPADPAELAEIAPPP